MRQLKWRDTDVPKSLCPTCGSALSGASSLEGMTPAPGDLSVCISCATVLRFDEALRLRPLEAGEWEALRQSDPDLAADLALYQAVIKTMPKPLRRGGY